MHLKAKFFLTAIFLYVYLIGIAQDKTVDTTFTDTEIHNTVNYEDDTIKSFQLLGSTHFHEKVDFGRSAFLKAAGFSGVTFSKKANFSNVAFFKMAQFYISTFSDDIDFSDATFLNGADFSGATPLKDVDFKNATFKKTLILSDITMGDSTQFLFEKTHLPDRIEISNNSKIYNEIDFTTANFTDSNGYDLKAVKPVLIYLYKSDISKLHLDYIHFKLLLPDSIWDGDRKTFISGDDKESMYEELLNNFKIRGQEESYKLCDIEYQTFKWNQHWYSKWFTWLPHYWWNWGYNKGLVFIWATGLMLIFTLITYRYIFYLNENVYKIENIPPSFNDNRFWYSFIYTSTVFFRLTLKIENIKFEKKLGTTYLILMYTVGLICLAYMANFVLQK